MKIGIFMKKYEQIATEIERKIISGEYKDFLPKQIELAKEYDTCLLYTSDAADEVRRV